MILTKEQFMELLKSRVGESTSESDLKFLEDMTDTYNSLEKESNVDWKEKYEKLDEEWKTRYKERFFSGSDSNENTKNEEGTTQQTSEEKGPEEANLEDSYILNLEGTSGAVVAI